METKPIKVDMYKVLNVHKNNRGDLGEMCSYCGGYGYTLSVISGGSNGCHRCDQTGIEPVNTHQLRKEFLEVKKELVELKNLIIKLAKEK